MAVGRHSSPGETEQSTNNVRPHVVLGALGRGKKITFPMDDAMAEAMRQQFYAVIAEFGWEATSNARIVLPEM